MSTVIAKKDEEIKQEIQAALAREPRIVNPDGIGVAVNDRVVTLIGHVHSYTDQLAAQAAAERVPGVEAVVQDIEVILPDESRRNDIEIAEAASKSLELNSSIPGGRIKVVVEDGYLSLDGEVERQYQKEEAESTVAKIRGVKGVTNNIKVGTQIRPIDVILQIEKEFQRMAALHARDIHVNVQGTRVILTGMTRAWIEKVEAERVVREMPGVTEVENQIELSPLLEGKENPPRTG